jgi:hypothetical protein
LWIKLALLSTNLKQSQQYILIVFNNAKLPAAKLVQQKMLSSQNAFDCCKYNLTLWILSPEIFATLVEKFNKWEN